MNKDFWERIDRLEELAKLFADDKVSYGTYIAAANPAMILEMIAEIRKLEKEADCLAIFLADICDYVADTDYCPVAEACVCPCDKCKDANKPEIWRKKARELVEFRTEAENA